MRSFIALISRANVVNGRTAERHWRLCDLEPIAEFKEMRETKSRASNGLAM